jgi:hypothetical protein
MQLDGLADLRRRGFPWHPLSSLKPQQHNAQKINSPFHMIIQSIILGLMTSFVAWDSDFRFGSSAYDSRLVPDPAVGP